MAEILKNKQLQIIVMALSFLFVFLPYFLNVPQLNTASTKLVTICSIVTAFTIALAVIAQFRRGMNIINRRSRGWYFKVYMLVTLVLMLGFSLMGRDSGPYQWVMFAVVNPLSSVNYGILAFYMASTAARAFRARNAKALMLLVSGFIVLMYQAPLTGAYFTGFEPVSIYLGSTFAMAAGRMFLISVTVGAIVFGVRVILGKEPGVLGISKEEK